MRREGGRGGVRCDDVGGYVAQVEAGFVVFGAWAGDDLAQEGGHCFGGRGPVVRGRIGVDSSKGI